MFISCWFCTTSSLCVVIAFRAIVFFTLLHFFFRTLPHWFTHVTTLFFSCCCIVFFVLLLYFSRPISMFFTHYLTTPFALPHSSSHVVSILLCCYGVLFTLFPYSSPDVVLFFLHCPCYFFCTMLVVFFMLLCYIINLFTLPLLWCWCSTFKYLLGQLLMSFFSHCCY